MAASSNADLDGIIFGSRSSSDQANVEILMEQYKLFVETSERLGLRTALCYHRAYARVLHPAMSVVFDPPPPSASQLNRAVDSFDQEIQRLWEGRVLAA